MEEQIEVVNKKRKIYEIWWLKIIARLLCIVSAIIVISALTALGLQAELGIYDNNVDNKIYEKYVQMNIDNSMEAFVSSEDSLYAIDRKNNNFNYGIIKADSLENVNVYSVDSYYTGNFSKIDKNADLFVCGIRIHEEKRVDGIYKELVYSGSYKDLMAKGFKNLQKDSDIIGTYWVISEIPQDVNGSLYGNEYSRVVYLYSKIQNILENYFQLFFGGIAIFIVAFAYLFWCTRNNINSNQKELHGIDKIWFDVWSFVLFVMQGTCIGFLVYLIRSFSENYIETFMMLIFALVVYVVTITITLEYLLSFYRRIICNQIFRYTCLNWIYRNIISRIFNIINQGFMHLDIFLKYIALIIGVNVIELIIFKSCDTKWFSIIIVGIFKACIYLLILKLILQMKELQKASEKLANGDLQYKVDTDRLYWDFKIHGENLNKISDGMEVAVNEKMKSERFKTELITNVSHDIKTPLTSIINYVDLLAKENIDNAKAQEYIEVLNRQALRLKTLIEDLVQVSKASSGNITVNMEKINVGVFLTQTVGEFEEKLSLNQLELIVNKPNKETYIMADGRHLWRVVDNLMSNICKYAQPGSRVYVNIEENNDEINIIFRNMSKYPLNISGNELAERFVRGDKSRNTEGHGLGLAIANSLTALMKAKMEIVVDGDLFKVIISFKALFSAIEEIR